MGPSDMSTPQLTHDTQPVPSSASSPVSMDDMRPRLAAELAAGLLPIGDILTRFDLTKQQLGKLLADPGFRRAIVDYREQWRDAGNARERIRVKAALAVEEGLIELYNMYINPELNPSARLDAYKQLVTLSATAPVKDVPENSGPQFSVTFNIPGAEQPLTIQGSANPVPSQES